MSDGKILVDIDPELEDLIPGFLSNRQRDIERVLAALAQDDFEAIRVIGHSMKGAGGGYGFDKLTELGAELEQAAIAQSRDEIKTLVDSLGDYLERVEVVYN